MDSAPDFVSQGTGIQIPQEVELSSWHFIAQSLSLSPSVIQVGSANQSQLRFPHPPHLPRSPFGVC